MAENLPLPVTTQWSEDRSFARLYHHNPHYQARLAMALCGLRAEKISEHSGDENHETVHIIDLALKEFAQSYPDFLSAQPEDPEVKLGDYEPDPLLVEQIQAITDKYD